MTPAAIDLALVLAGDGGIDAFAYANALSLGLEGLPAAHRPATHAALLARGFRGDDLWLYMVGEAEGPDSEDVGQLEATYSLLTGDESGWCLAVRDRRGETIANAVLELGPQGKGVVWWLEVKPEFRRRGLGRALFRQARRRLAKLGAEQVLLFVDHDDPAKRAHRPAIALYESEGFRAVDRIWSYQRGERLQAAPRERR